jgi:undecaprenyl-diphosphatase
LIETLKQIDAELFLFLNGLHNSFFDFVMYWVSDRFIWIPMYLVFIVLIIKKYKKRSWFILLFVALTIASSDQLINFAKHYFERLRPCHDESLQALVHTVRGHCGGKYSFVSGHSGNAFSLAFFLIPFFKPHYRYFTLFILIWAALVAYSRVYLGVHFPGDILAGALLGSLVGTLWARVYILIFPMPQAV